MMDEVRLRSCGLGGNNWVVVGKVNKAAWFVLESGHRCGQTVLMSYAIGRTRRAGKAMRCRKVETRHARTRGISRKD